MQKRCGKEENYKEELKPEFKSTESSFTTILKNPRRLIKYSRLFKIEDKIRKYMEVLS